jgi:hypothetical protein
MVFIRFRIWIQNRNRNFSKGCAKYCFEPVRNLIQNRNRMKSFWSSLGSGSSILPLVIAGPYSLLDPGFGFDEIKK